jgi:D-alanyl-D-alanine dipeptidase
LYYYPLQQLDQDTFRFPDHGLYQGEELKFARDASGRATRVIAAGVTLERRNIEPREWSYFSNSAGSPCGRASGRGSTGSHPPQEVGDFRKPELMEVTCLDPTIRLDIRYATNNNFTGATFYNQARAFLQAPAAEALARVHRRLGSLGLGLLVHDAYRPWYVTKMFWEATPQELRAFVANPARGSRHNRGCALDLTLFDRNTGQAIQMPSGYDEFTPRAYAMYPGRHIAATLLSRSVEASDGA